MRTILCMEKVKGNPFIKQKKILNFLQSENTAEEWIVPVNKIRDEITE